ncbi:MAG: RsmD family RNA methyltransferase [Firmicutes bacterium]|nr:RsmD family RNA methyltransferase [Bacillota bacterium]
MRIIAGTLKGRRLQAPPEGERRVRPTADRAREALFSILQAWPQGGFLDLFAGTGAVAVEAWSRGYDPVICVEKEAAALGLVQANAKGTSVRILRQDALGLKEDAFQDLAVIFADPPYEHSAACFTRLTPRLRLWLQPGGLLVWETDAKTELPEAESFEPLESRRYGAGRFHFFRAG